MLNFLIISVFYLLAEVAALRLFFFLIQEGSPIDVLWRWITGRGYQDMLKDLYASNKKWKNNLGKAIGDCEMCLSFWFPPVCFIVYAIFCRLVLHYWITDEVTVIPGACFVNFVWYICLHSISAFMGWIILLKTKKNAV